MFRNINFFILVVFFPAFGVYVSEWKNDRKMETNDLFQEAIQYSELLRKYLEGELSPAERQELAKWLRQSHGNREIWRRFKCSQHLKDYYVRRQQIDPGEEYRLLLHRFPELREKKSRRLPVWTWPAAAVAVLLAMAVWQWPDKRSRLAERPATEKIIAVLRTSQGEVYRLDGQGGEIPSARLQGLQVKDSLKELVCQRQDVSDSAAFNELEIPKGGEYKLVLADGTKVWLNSETVIRFPAKFGLHSREIGLQGEAYFEVARDSCRPFRVKAGNGMVEVLGTNFVINVYPHERQWSATLLRGSVRADFDGQSCILSPGQQAYVKAGRLLQREVDIEKEAAWVKGFFIFRHDSLEEVTRKLARWYDVEFRYETEKLKSYVFTGQVSRDIGIEQILSLMERMNVVSFEQKDGYIFIKEKAGKP